MLYALEIILFILSLVLLFILAIYLCASKKFLYEQNISRLRVGKIYLSTTIVLFILCMIFINFNPNHIYSNGQIQKTSTTISSSKWKDKIKEIVSNDKNSSEKFDEISNYAHKYKPTKDEIKTFGNEIIKEFTNKTYLKDLSNHEYMITNIFKSDVIERNTSKKLLKDFAFNFWQNSKYNYRSLEYATSTATQANERQMDNTLSEIKK
ncbi:hypothetical protein [Bacillus thuringiensis]|uniref:hypothetical protein n=1 Tax=Bacillus thuringiensis TaxID=1428 RepID=UPI000BF45023|nr:hypothetical protein [Bacillus thuringiensis]PFN63942.1 hypothetical protein COJ75_00250 [Bacillus thuringiensis]